MQKSDIGGEILEGTARLRWASCRTVKFGRNNSFGVYTYLRWMAVMIKRILRKIPEADNLSVCSVSLS
jgi:hypothetical protein